MSERGSKKSSKSASKSSKGSSRKSGSEKDKKKRLDSSVFSHFTQDELREYKAGFQFIDGDRDGIISRDDLRTCYYDVLGVLINEQDIDGMMSEAPNPVNFTQFIALFAEHLGGEMYDKATVRNAVGAYMNADGMISADRLRTMLQKKEEGPEEPFTLAEVDAAFTCLDVDKEGFIDGQEFMAILCAGDPEDDVPAEGVQE